MTLEALGTGITSLAATARTCGLDGHPLEVSSLTPVNVGCRRSVPRASLSRRRQRATNGVSAALGGLHKPSPTEAVTALRARVPDFAEGALTDDLGLPAARIT
jgi:hypothetical protein